MKVSVCPICGDRGFIEALILCHRCQMRVIHRYCLAKLPVPLTKDVKWFCEDCESEITTPCTDDDDDDLSPRKNKVKHIRKKKKIHDTDEAVADIPESESNPDLSESVADIPKSESNPDLSESFADIPEIESNPDLSESVADIPKCDSNPDISKSVTVAPICESTPTNKLIEVDCSDNFIKYPNLGQEKVSSQEDAENSGQEVESMKSLKCHSSQMVAVVSPNRSNHFSQMAIVDSSNISNPNPLVHAQPIVDPVWCGTFRFSNENRTVSGLVAHLSSLACSKVVVASKLLPAILELELLPRSEVWPKSFRTTRPTGDHIALYFFPDNERDEQVFDTLVCTMCDADFAMRAVVENAELLIFHSTVLPIPYWRFKMKNYLWGLFKKKQAPPSLNVRDGRDEEAHKNTITTYGVQSPVSTLSNSNGSPDDPDHTTACNMI